MKYSNNLVIQIKKYFKNRYNSDISDGEAQQYLDNLAELYLSFS